MSLDIIDSKILYLLPLVKKKTPPKNNYKIFPDNKHIEKIDLPRNVYDLLVKEALPNISDHLHTATVGYTLTNTVGSKMFNFNKFINNLYGKVFLGNNSTLPYECTGSLYLWMRIITTL